MTSKQYIAHTTDGFTSANVKLSSCPIQDQMIQVSAFISPIYGHGQLHFPENHIWEVVLTNGDPTTEVWLVDSKSSHIRTIATGLRICVVELLRNTITIEMFGKEDTGKPGFVDTDLPNIQIPKSNVSHSFKEVRRQVITRTTRFYWRQIRVRLIQALRELGQQDDI